MNVKFIPAPDDGSVDERLPEHVYLHLIVMGDGEDHGRLSGYFHPAVAEHIRKALGVAATV